MGITGLIPFLSKSSNRANIKQFSGQTVAIDAYCWLHKGAFSCADKLVMNEPTNVYIMYCMKFVNMLLSHNIKPILVFDGRYLAAKGDTESKRRENRELNRKKGAELLRAGRTEEGRNYLRRSVDISHEMALQVIKECRSRNVDCIVAPYEADAQLAYLNIKNIAQVVITEDSDLLLFGCTKVMFKMDVNGNGILVEKDRLHLSMDMRPDLFTIDKFRYMCILSGCDYLASLPGIGLAKACKFIKRTSETDIYEALRKLPCNLNMWTLVITDEYRDNFVKADKTFRYQLVYDPIQRKQVPLNEVENEDDIIGKKLDDETAFQLAIGNLDPMNLKKMDDYNPDKAVLKKNNAVAKHKSIWSNDFSIRVSKPQTPSFQRTSTAGISITTHVSVARKRPNEFESSKAPELIKEELLNFYGGEAKRSFSSSESLIEEVSPSSPTTPKSPSPLIDSNKSPVLSTRKNPFAVRDKKISVRRSYLEGLKKFSMTTSNDATSSKYFQSSETAKKSEERISVLDILDGSKSPKEEIHEKTVISESDDQMSVESLNESRRSISPNKSLLIEKDEEDSELMKSSQEENILNVSNVDIDIEDFTIQSRFSKFLSNKNGAVKSFYDEPKNEESCNVSNGDCSEFFKSPEKSFSRGLEKSFSRSPEKPIFKTSSPVIPKLINSSSKKLPRTGLNQPKKGIGKQGLLSQFGFQPRPKILNEKKLAS